MGMNRTCWWLVDVVSRMLEPGERDVVLGDFAESGESRGRALCDILGLVVRRQAALWKDWRPWLVLAGLIVPLGMLLSIVARLTAGQTATYTWLYANNWDWALLRYAGFWYEFAGSAALVFVSCLTLVCWSWTAGFVLGSLSRSIVRLYGLLFCLMLVLGGLLGAPLYVGFLVEHIHRPSSPDEQDPVFGLMFYRVMFPLIVQAVLVAAPSLWGIRQGAEARGFPRSRRIVLWTVAIGALTVMLIREPGLVFILNVHWLYRFWQSWHMRLLQPVVYWPVGYFVANAIRQRWHGKTAS